MKITCERLLGEEEMQDCISSAKLMDFMGWNKQWIGDGMLYRTTAKDEFHFVDQKYEETL